MDLWPGNEEGVGRSNVGTDVIAYYGVTTTTVDDILNTDISGQERGLAPQGVIQISTNYESDMKTMQSMTEFMQTNIYNGRDRNCSDFAKL